MLVAWPPSRAHAWTNPWLAVDPHEQGAIAGLTGATSGAGFIFGPMIATGLYRISPSAPYIFGSRYIALLRDFGGAKRVNHSFAVPPASEEQIIDPVVTRSARCSLSSRSRIPTHRSIRPSRTRRCFGPRMSTCRRTASR